MQRAVYELDAAALHTNIRARTFWGGGASAHVGPQERSDRHNPASSGAGFVATQKRAGDAKATLCPSWRRDREVESPMSLLTWTVSDSGVHHATSGAGATAFPGRMVECRGLWPAGTAAAVRLLRVRTSRARRR